MRTQGTRERNSEQDYPLIPGGVKTSRSVTQIANPGWSSVAR